jgi:hypothetical protein
MGKKYNNLISTTAGFKYNAQQPLDDRAVVEKYDDLAELVSSNVAYEGMEVYVDTDKKSYKLVNSEWKAVATEDFVAEKVAEAALEGKDIDLSDYAKKEDLVGKSNDLGGEIFNDYENNQALKFSSASGHNTSAGIGVFRFRKMMKNTDKILVSIDQFKLPDNIDKNDTVIELKNAIWAYIEIGSTTISGASGYLDLNTSMSGATVYTLFVDIAELPSTLLNDPIWQSIPEGIVLTNDMLPGLDSNYVYFPSADFRIISEEDITDNNVVDAAHAEGSHTFAAATGSHAEGADTTAAAYASHAEGGQTRANAPYAHAEGVGTKAMVAGHSEGGWTAATGDYAHAQNLMTEATGVASHAGGWKTRATTFAQTAIGKANAENAAAIFIVGNGTSDEDRKNAFTVNLDGTATVQKTGTGNDNVVSYGQMVSYVAENSTTEIPSEYITENELNSKGYLTEKSLDGFATETYVAEKVADLVDSAPGALDTLNELAKALGNDENFSTTVATEIGKKVDKIDGKNLSSNDYTDEDKATLATIKDKQEKLVAGDNIIIEGNTISAVVSEAGTVDQEFNPESENAQSGTAISKVLVGKITEAKGEIFNDYENNKAIGGYSTANGYDNIAGGKGFCIKNIVDGLDYETVISEMSIQATNSYTFSGVTLEEGATYRLKMSGTVSLSGEPDVEVNIDEDYTAFYEEYFDLVALMIEARFADLPYNGGYSSINSTLTIGHAKNDSNYSDLSLTIRPTGSYTDRSVNFNLTISLQKIGVSSSTKNIEISDATGIEVNDIFSLYSAKLPGNFDFVGKVLEVAGNLISVDNHNNSNLLTMLNTLEGNVDGSSSEYIWFPNKPNLNGDITMGTGASASGYSTKAVMVGAHTEGYNTIAAGKYAHAEGNSTIAGYASHSEGIDTQAIARQSHAEGKATKALKDDSHAEGNSSIADGYHSHAEGLKTKTEGTAAHSEGSETQALAEASHAEGKKLIANGIASHAEGEGGRNYAKASHVEGFNTKVGDFDDKGNLITTTTEKFSGAHAEGFYTKAQKDGAHAEGDNTQAFGKGSHAEGSATKATSLTYQEGIIGANHAEGHTTIATYPAAHAEGYKTEATHIAAHTEGINTKASGKAGHAEGWNTKASGYYSHAEGTDTVAYNTNSHAGGLGTKAMRANQTVIGTYNTNNYDALFIVGNGDDDANRNNAFMVNANGTATIQAVGTNDLNVVNYKQLKDYTTNHRNIFSGAELPESTTGYIDGDIFIVFEE